MKRITLISAAVVQGGATSVVLNLIVAAGTAEFYSVQTIMTVLFLA